MKQMLIYWVFILWRCGSVAKRQNSPVWLIFLGTFILSQFENHISDFMELIIETYPYLEATVNLPAEGKHILYLCPVVKFLHAAEMGSLWKDLTYVKLNVWTFLSPCPSL